MTTLAERLEQLRQGRDAEAADSTAQHDELAAAHWQATDQQLRKLIRAEIDVTDDLGESEKVHQPYSHGGPEGLFAVIRLGDFWFGLPVTDHAADDNQLITLVHCPNSHVLHMEYPHSGDDTWGQALLRTEDAQQIYSNTNNCPQCVAYRTTARSYQPRV